MAPRMGELWLCLIVMKQPWKMEAPMRLQTQRAAGFERQIGLYSDISYPLAAIRQSADFWAYLWLKGPLSEPWSWSCGQGRNGRQRPARDITRSVPFQRIKAVNEYSRYLALWWPFVVP